MVEVDLQKTQFTTAVAVLSIIFSLVIAPLWFIFQFDVSLFESTDTIKLLLLCPGISGPLLIINTFAIRAILAPKVLILSHADWAASGLFSSVCFYLPAVISFFHHFTLYGAITVAMFPEFVLLAIAAVIVRQQKKNNSLPNRRP